MPTRTKQGSRDGVEWRTDTKGTTRYRGVVNLKATGKQRGPWCGSHAEAKGWVVKARAEAQAGTRRRSSGLTLREAWETFYTAAVKGTATDRSGNVYKPSTLRNYKTHFAHVDRELGAHRLDAVKRADLQALIDGWAADGVTAATIRNRLDPVRTVYRRAMQRDQVVVNPTVNLDVPRVNNNRERFATREEAAELIAALPEGEQAIWATAFYGGLRRGELMALRWSDVDLDAGLIRVQRSWDAVEGEGETKTRAGNRRVPITGKLGGYLKAHRDRTGRSGRDLVFGREAALPFVPSTVRGRALAAWETANDAKAKQLGRELRDGEGLTPIGLHECRHTFASLMIAAGCNAKALSVVMGHESITITFDRYGKLMPGGEQQVGELLGAYLDA